MVTSKLKIEKLLQCSRDSLTDYCIKICKSQCCKKGKLLIQTKEEIDLICVKAPMVLKEIITMKREDGSYELLLDLAPCPSLCSDSKCTIYKESYRPKICAEFPVFLRETKIIVSEFCPATKEKFFEKFIKSFEKEGYKVIRQ